MSSWTEHTSESGKVFYYDRISGKSQWNKPTDFGLAKVPHISLQRCAEDSTAVASLLNAIIKHCGASSIPTVATMNASDPF